MGKSEQFVAENDGSSVEKAIVTNSTKDLASVSEEYAWIKEHYPVAKTQNQALIHKNAKSYDKLHILLTNGQEKDLYFDITAGFGHF